MLQVLTTFNLKSGVKIGEFREMLADLERRLRQRDLIVAFGEPGRRFRHPIMDTDEDRDHAYFFLMSFRDREQCNCAIQLMRDDDVTASSVHRSLYGMVEDPVFSCWETVLPARPGH